jgi:hypothetical protein
MFLNDDLIGIDYFPKLDFQMFGDYKKANKLFQILRTISLEASIRIHANGSGNGANDGATKADATASNDDSGGQVFSSTSPTEDECWEIWTGHAASGDCVMHT